MMNPSMIDWATLINSGGVVVVLVFVVGWFMTGKLIAKKTHDEILAGRHAEIKLHAEEICKGMKEAVRKGFVEAHNEINGKK